MSQELEHKVLSEVEECIGCNDCMVACPLDETKWVSIADLNEAVWETEVSSPEVAAFVTACTQCQQCVPVCPTDLSRADMVLFNKLKVQDVAPDRRVALMIGDRTAVSRWTTDSLTAWLTRFPAFAAVEPRSLRRLVMQSTLRQLAPDEELVAEGTFHESLFIVVEGALRQVATNAVGGLVELLRIQAGVFIGETAVLANRREPYGMRAVDQSHVLEVPKAAVLSLARLSPPFDEVLRELASERSLDIHAARSPFLGLLPATAREQLLASAVLRTLQPAETLQALDTTVEHYAIVVSGFLSVQKRFSRSRRTRMRTVDYLSEGRDFGIEAALNYARPSTVAIAAKTLSDVLLIPIGELRKILTAHPEARRAIGLLISGGAAKWRHEEGAAAKSTTKARTGTSRFGLTVGSMLDAGLAKGHQVLAIDQRSCTDCNACVDACGARHGTPRLERRGVQAEHLLFPSACRHCDDPVCLMCTVGGIVRLPDGQIQIVEDNCIGCGSCASRCPYGNIRMGPKDVQRPTGLRHHLLDMLVPTHLREHGAFATVTRWLGGPATSATDDAPQVAHKCDLCAGHADQACVSACPTGAAFRADGTELLEARDGE